MRIGWLLLFAALAAGQPASDLLQSAIYAQEASGDLDMAIRIYQQILSAGPGQRMYAPQAQFRLGQCLLRKGDRRGAAAAFQAVIRNYPEQAALIARARGAMPGGEELLPKPWQDREIAEYRWIIPGVEDAWSIAHIAPSPGTRANDRIQLHYYIPAGHALRVDVERSSMRPTAVINSGVPRRADSSGSAYESAEIVYLLRRKVLAPGIRGNMPLNLPDGEPVTLQFAVHAVEDVTVPAGKFSCYRVRLSVPRPHFSILEGTWLVPADSEFLWYGTGPGRPLVRMASGGAVGELTALRTAEPSGQTVQRDPALGYSFVLPSDWVNHTRISPNREQTTIDLHHVESDMSIRILLDTYVTTRAFPLDVVVANRVRILTERQPAYTVLGQMTKTTLAGRPALSWMAGMGRSTEYGICVQSESLLATITVQTPASDFERLRARFQPILDSFRLR
jgi:hypothetical protein